MSKAPEERKLYLAFDSEAGADSALDQGDEDPAIAMALRMGEVLDAVQESPPLSTGEEEKMEKMVAWAFGVRPYALRRLADKDPALIPKVGRFSAPENKK
jgi:hypothetical protein